MNVSIGIKTSALLSVLVISGISAMGYINFRDSRSLLIKASVGELATASQVIGGRFESTFEAFARDVLFVSQVPVIAEILLAKTAGMAVENPKDYLASLFESLLTTRPEYTRITLIGTADSGREIVRVDRDGENTRRIQGVALRERQDSDYYSEAIGLSRGKLFYSDISLNREVEGKQNSKHPAIHIVAPVYVGDSRPAALVVLAVDLEALFASLHAHTPVGANLHLASDAGNILIDSDQSKVFGFEFGRAQLLQTDFPQIQPLFSGTRKRVVIDSTWSVNGNDRIAFFERVPYADHDDENFVVIGLSFELANVLQGIETLRDRTTAIIFSVGLMATLLAVLLARFISFPLNLMTRAVRRFAQGKSMGQIPRGRQDEIGLLADAFVDMSSQIDHQLLTLQATEQRLTSILGAVPSLIIIFRIKDGNVLFMNDKCMQRMNITAEQLRHVRIADYFMNLDDRLDLLTRLRQSKRIDNLELELKSGEGGSFWALLSAIEMEYQGARAALISFTDISELKAADALIEHQANFDSLTNLPNRTLFLDRLAQALVHAHRQRNLVALLFLDLDQFKSVNDSLGHSAGDSLLKQTAQRLTSVLRDSDTVARLGGDEFTIVLEAINQPREVELVTRKIIETLVKPYILNGVEVFISASIGIALAPLDAESVEHLLKKADSAMYAAKEAGRNTYRFFTPQMQAEADDRLRLVNDLKRAEDREEFELYYQPVVDLRYDRVSNVEALLRWRISDEETIPAQCFIALSEDMGLIKSLGEWAIEKACAQAKIWCDNGFPDLRISVNVSSRQFARDNMYERIRGLLEKTGVSASHLIIEITENMLARERSDIIRQLLSLRATGLQIYLDDFGTGFSSLGYLRNFPITAVKIDNSFIRNLNLDQDNAALVEAIISMAHNLNIMVVAEGVETEDQLEFLRSHGCDYAQGFYFCEPVTPRQFEKYMQNNWLKADDKCQDIMQ